MIALCAALILAGTAISHAALPASATNMSSITSEKIQEMEQQIDAAEKEKNNLQNNISDLQKITKELEALKGDLKKYVAALDQNVAVMEENLAALQEQITVKEQEIEQKTLELAVAEDTAAGQYDSMRMRIRLMYETNVTAALWNLFADAKSLQDILNAADCINRIYAYDQEKWEEYMLNSRYIRLCKEQLELEQEILNGQKKSVEEEQKRVEALITQKQQQIDSYESDISNKENAIREYEADLKEQSEIIEQLEKAVADEKKQILMNNGLVLTYDGGAFVFPVEKYTRVSSDYGYRIHPTLGVRQFHNGVDLASPKGTPIYAAYDGVVVAATYSSTMGNYVMINHGGGLYTIYMHASKLLVKVDDIVARGDTIAKVGSTGRSTGNHLHFTVRLNGEYMNPWNYISK